MSSKLSRKVLKGIVKECMLEIMEESFFLNSSNSMMQERLQERQRKQEGTNQQIDSGQYRNTLIAENKNEKVDRHSYLDNISYKEKGSVEKNQNFEAKVDSITSTMTSDPILASILRDTALTTLQEQTSAESNKSSMPMSKGDMAARAASQNTPDKLFGQEVASKWASLAFAN